MDHPGDSLVLVGFIYSRVIAGLSCYWSFERKTYTWSSRKSSYFDIRRISCGLHVKSKDHLQGIVTLCLILCAGVCHGCTWMPIILVSC